MFARTAFAIAFLASSLPAHAGTPSALYCSSDARPVDGLLTEVSIVPNKAGKHDVVLYREGELGSSTHVIATDLECKQHKLLFSCFRGRGENETQNSVVTAGQMTRNAINEYGQVFEQRWLEINVSSDAVKAVSDEWQPSFRFSLEKDAFNSGCGNSKK